MALRRCSKITTASDLDQFPQLAQLKLLSLFRIRGSSIRARLASVHKCLRICDLCKADCYELWGLRNEIQTLNVAGPRASNEPELGDFVKQVLEDAFPT